jgi:hypothetical protein
MKVPTTRAGDLALLDALLADDVELRDDERERFEDMREKLADWTMRELTGPQRKWLTEAANRLGVDLLTPAERNADVPRGREVTAPAVLSQDSLRKALEMRRRLG